MATMNKGDRSIVSNLGPWPCRVLDQRFVSISEYDAAIIALADEVLHAGGVGLLVGRLPRRTRLCPIAATLIGDVSPHAVATIYYAFKMAEENSGSPVAAAVCAMKGLLESGDWPVQVPVYGDW